MNVLGRSRCAKESKRGWARVELYRGSARHCEAVFILFGFSSIPGNYTLPHGDDRASDFASDRRSLVRLRVTRLRRGFCSPPRRRALGAPCNCRRGLMHGYLWTSTTITAAPQNQLSTSPKVSWLKVQRSNEAKRQGSWPYVLYPTLPRVDRRQVRRLIDYQHNG